MLKQLSLPRQPPAIVLPRHPVLVAASLSVLRLQLGFSSEMSRLLRNPAPPHPQTPSSLAVKKSSQCQRHPPCGQQQSPNRRHCAQPLLARECQDIQAAREHNHARRQQPAGKHVALRGRVEENSRVKEMVGRCCVPGGVRLGVTGDAQQGVRAKGAQKDCARARETCKLHKHLIKRERDQRDHPP